jgi:hypothetical protein
VIDLAATIPTMLPERLRNEAREALERSADPLNKLDDNPYIGQEWLLVSSVLWSAAASLDTRLSALFEIGRTLEAGDGSLRGRS